jgi:hypothetical protein
MSNDGNYFVNNIYEQWAAERLSQMLPERDVA